MAKDQSAREAHTLSERHRRERISNTVTELKRILPSTALPAKPQVPDVLEAAHLYMVELLKLVQACHKHHSKLWQSSEAAYYKTQNQQLRSILRHSGISDTQEMQLIDLLSQATVRTSVAEDDLETPCDGISDTNDVSITDTLLDMTVPKTADRFGCAPHPGHVLSSVSNTSINEEVRDIDPVKITASLENAGVQTLETETRNKVAEQREIRPRIHQGKDMSEDVKMEIRSRVIGLVHSGMKSRIQPSDETIVPSVSTAGQLSTAVITDDPIEEPTVSSVQPEPSSGAAELLLDYKGILIPIGSELLQTLLSVHQSFGHSVGKSQTLPDLVTPSANTQIDGHTEVSGSGNASTVTSDTAEASTETENSNVNDASTACNIAIDVEMRPNSHTQASASDSCRKSTNKNNTFTDKGPSGRLSVTYPNNTNITNVGSDNTCSSKGIGETTDGGTSSRPVTNRHDSGFDPTMNSRLLTEPMFHRLGVTSSSSHSDVLHSFSSVEPYFPDFSATIAPLQNINLQHDSTEFFSDMLDNDRSVYNTPWNNQQDPMTGSQPAPNLPPISSLTSKRSQTLFRPAGEFCPPGGQDSRSTRNFAIDDLISDGEVCWQPQDPLSAPRQQYSSEKQQHQTSGSLSSGSFSIQNLAEPGIVNEKQTLNDQQHIYYHSSNQSFSIKDLTSNQGHRNSDLLGNDNRSQQAAPGVGNVQPNITGSRSSKQSQPQTHSNSNRSYHLVESIISDDHNRSNRSAVVSPVSSRPIKQKNTAPATATIPTNSQKSASKSKRSTIAGDESSPSKNKCQKKSPRQRKETTANLPPPFWEENMIAMPPEKLHLHSHAFFKNCETSNNQFDIFNSANSAPAAISSYPWYPAPSTRDLGSSTNTVNHSFMDYSNNQPGSGASFDQLVLSAATGGPQNSIRSRDKNSSDLVTGFPGTSLDNIMSEYPGLPQQSHFSFESPGKHSIASISSSHHSSHRVQAPKQPTHTTGHLIQNFATSSRGPRFFDHLQHIDIPVNSLSDFPDFPNADNLPF